MQPDRRSLGQRLLGGLAGLWALAGTPSAASAATGAPPRVVYHLSDFTKVHFVLGNMQNHVDGMGGSDKVALTLVVHGPALDYFTLKQADGNVVNRVHALLGMGARFIACGNTMKAANLTVADLVPGFQVAEEGGVVRLAILQADGYAYLRP